QSQPDLSLPIPHLHPILTSLLLLSKADLDSTMFLLDYLHHRRDCRFKQDERTSRIRALTAYHAPFSVLDRETINRPIEELVQDVQKDSSKAADLLLTYGKVAFKAHAKTNCVTEILIKDAEKWIKDGSINFKGPLAGIPISLKDTIDVKGYDSTVGMTCKARHPRPEDGATVRLLKDLGAVPYVKTNIPITLLSFESANDIWGRSTNPYNSKYAPGGSTGGEGALLALGGRIGIGSDVAGSVRCPAHFSGIYALKCSTGRWPKLGMNTSMPGQDGVPAVYSPMARTLNDLLYFTRAVIQKGTWNYDHSCHPMPWRSDVVKEYKEKKTMRVGVFRTDGIIDPSPACKRALEITEAALRRAGHQIVEIDPPSPYEGLYLASRLLCADGLGTIEGFLRTGEWNDRGAAQMSYYAKLPRFIKYVHYLWVRYVRRDPLWAGLLRDWHPTSTQEYWSLIARREAYKRGWYEMWDDAKLDFIIAPPNATPAVPHNGMHDAVSSCAYTFLFNLIDYSAGVIPVTHVDRIKDRLPSNFNVRKLNGIARGAYKLYDAEAMHGLPVGVQVIGRRLEEEKVLTLMGRVEDALGDDKFKLLEVD
ncbi:Acetamidase, partial [Tolypocladium ophioglossoides CBS 100239]